NHRSGELRPEAELSIPIAKGVHPTSDGLTMLAEEKLRRFQDRGIDWLIAIQGERLVEAQLKRTLGPPARRKNDSGTTDWLNSGRFHGANSTMEHMFALRWA